MGRAARLVVALRRGKEVLYWLADEHVAHIVHEVLCFLHVGRDLANVRPFAYSWIAVNDVIARHPLA